MTFPLRLNVPPQSAREWASSCRAEKSDALQCRGTITTDSAYQKGFVADLPITTCIFGRQSRRLGRQTLWPSDPLSEHLGHLFAQVHASVGAADRRRHDVAGLQLLGPAALRRYERGPEATLGQQAEQAPDRRRRNSKCAAARRSGEKHVSGRDVGEGRQFRDRLCRLEDEVRARIVPSRDVVHREAQIKPIEKREFIRFEDRETRPKNVPSVDGLSHSSHERAVPTRDDGPIAIARFASPRVPHREAMSEASRSQMHSAHN